MANLSQDPPLCAHAPLRQDRFYPKGFWEEDSKTHYGLASSAFLTLQSILRTCGVSLAPRMGNV